MQYTEFVKTDTEDREVFTMLVKKNEGDELPPENYYSLVPRAEVDELEVLRHRKTVTIHPDAALITVAGAAALLMGTGNLDTLPGFAVIMCCLLLGMSYRVPWKMS